MSLASRIFPSKCAFLADGICNSDYFHMLAKPFPEMSDVIRDPHHVDIRVSSGFIFWIKNF